MAKARRRPGDADRIRLKRAKFLVGKAYEDCQGLVAALAVPAAFQGLEVTWVGDPKQLSQDCCQQIMALLEANMAEHYPGRWEDEKQQKEKEMAHKDARYIILRQGAGTAAELGEGSSVPALLGFVQYRFLEDDNDPVLYVYEIQVAAGARGKGLGKAMMDACEELAKQSSMDRVVLTVHLSNEAAGRFYAARGYVPDRTDPRLCDPSSTVDYRILSKACGP